MGQEIPHDEFIQEQLHYTTSPQSRPGWKMRYDFALQFITPDDVVLDCGCGLAENTHMIAQRCAKAVGVDIDDRFIAHNRGKWPDLTFHRADATQALPFPDEQFSVAVSIETLEHLPTMSAVQAALKNFHRVLKPGGLFIASGPHHAIAGTVSLGSLGKLWLRRCFGPLVSQQASWHGHYRSWPPDVFRGMLAGHFTDVTLYGQHETGMTEELEGAPYLMAVARKRAAQ